MIPGRHDMVVARWGARFLGRRFACAIGRGGITLDKREGDGATPAGAWHIVGAGFRPDRLARLAVALPMQEIGPTDIWSDDMGDPGYNHGHRAFAYPFSHERLRRADRLYDLVLMTDWNWPEAQPGRGSAIFIHRWRKPRHPTEGCIAFAAPDLRWIAERWTPHSRVIVRYSG